VHKKNCDPLVLGPAFAMDRTTVAPGEVTSLAHEVRDHTVELRVLKVKRLPGSSLALLSGAQSPEVLRGPRVRVRVQLHHDAAGRSTADIDVKENPGVGSHPDKIYTCKRNTIT
jgi:hypothetical protein